MDSENTNNFYVIAVAVSATDLPLLKDILGDLALSAEFCLLVAVGTDAQAGQVNVDDYVADLEGGTDMTVLEGKAGCSLESQKVYLLDSGVHYGIENGKLVESTVEAEHPDFTPVNQLFKSMARSVGERSVGLILSGDTIDGLTGARSIKLAGGFILVLETTEGKSSRLSHAIIKAGFADLQTTATNASRKLSRILQSDLPTDLAISRQLTDQDHAAIERILSQIRLTCDHDFSHYRSSTVLRRIRRRLPLRDINNLDAYADLLSQDRDETMQLYEDILITVTEFFRDPCVFQTLAEEVIPQLFEGKGSKDTVRLWSAGCATGEEAYSLAILLEEHASELIAPPGIMVFASDMHLSALQSARRGFFPSFISEKVSKERLERFFTQTDDGYRVKKFLRDRIVFASHNMLREPPFSRLDLVCCRNVMIYLRREVQRRLLELFHYALRPDGYLLIGSAETVVNAEIFRVFDKEANLYHCHKVPSTHLRLPMSMPDASTQRLVDASLRSPPSEVSYGAMHQCFMEQFGPPSVLVNAEQNIVHFSEQANRYLYQPSGEPTNQILKRIREELRVELRGALFMASCEKKNVRSKPVSMSIDGQASIICVNVNQLGSSASPDGYLLVWFDEVEVDGVEAITRHSGVDGRHIQNLEHELEETHNRLQALIEEYETSQEEMRSSNEELQSTNEELRSTLEELETGKEELQSVNEELTTLNLENRSKVEELSRMTNDLNNFLAATDIATLFLDQDLCILLFTPQANQIFSVRQSDVGRPVNELNSRLDYPDLYKDAKLVQGSRSPIEREVLSEDGHWFDLRILPYRTIEDNVKGVVITLHDITRLKQAENAAVLKTKDLSNLKEGLEARVEERTKLVRELAGRITIAEQAERDRIAQILHDDLQQQLCSLQMEVLGERDASKIKAEVVEVINQRLATMIELSRRLTVDLSPPLLKSEGIADGLRYLRTQMKNDFDFQVNLSSDRGGPRLNKDLRILLFQIVRELLFNAYKHSGMKEVNVDLEQRGDCLHVDVYDSGVGFDTDILSHEAYVGTGRGLSNLTNRLSFVGGKVNIDSAKYSGCRVHIEIPHEGEKSKEV